MSNNPPKAPLTEKERKTRLKRARLALKKKINTVTDEIRKDLTKTRYARMHKRRKARNKTRLMIAGGVILLIGLLALVFAPRKGGVTFGLCKTFVELRVEYPDELRFTYARSFPGNKMRLWYVLHDSFGQKKIEKMDCFFHRNRHGQIYMAKAEINRGEIGAKEIKSFNASIPAILDNMPDLTLPKGFPSDVKRYRR